MRKSAIEDSEMNQPFRSTMSPTGTLEGPTPVGLEAILLRVADAGLIGVPLVTPWFMGGRHPLGEFVLVMLAVLVAVFFLAGQLSAPRAAAPVNSRAQWILLAAIALVVLQV